MATHNPWGFCFAVDGGWAIGRSDGLIPIDELAFSGLEWDRRQDFWG